MDWTCPRCGSRTYHYDRTRIQNRCDGCGCPVEDPQQTQKLMQYDRTLAGARENLRAGNWAQTVAMISPLAREHPADIQLHRLILQAATNEFRDYEMGDNGLRTAASEAWDRLARLNGLTGEMLRYSRSCYERRIGKLTAQRDKFLRYILIAGCLFLYMGFCLSNGSDCPYLLVVAGLIWALYRAVNMYPSEAIRVLREAPPAWSANPFVRKKP